jgi:EAL domain-containing protein (putative c-di-GMP-specific phosphodiesterase class I)
MNYPAIELPPVVPALERCEFALHRICALESSSRASFGGQWDWFEMLIRPDRRSFSGSPGDFVTLIYSQHPASRVDRLVIDRAGIWLQGRKRPTRLSVNIHPNSLLDAVFRKHVAAVQRRLLPMRHSLCLELVEFGECVDRGALVASARLLREQGLQIALDDFGTQFNCFDLCAAGVVDVIKIDAVMVDEFHLDPNKQAVINSIQALGRGIGASVIAEGVECAEVVASLRQMGIDFAQGFYFHKPELAGI